MNISLEEHVARALAEADGNLPDWWDRCQESNRHYFIIRALAAIAAVREYGEAEADKWIDYAAELEGQRASIRESERAACEAIAREEVEANDYTHRGPAVRIADAIAARKGKGEGE
jgi:hypothetical protein